MTVTCGAVTCGVVLAGGRSSRMGRDKATLPWGGATMLDAVVAALREALPHVIVVAAAEQSVQVDAVLVRDPVPGQGPLRGMATGLAAAAEAGHDWALVAATDIPLLSAEVLGRLLSSDLDCDVVLATADGRDQPLVALYRTSLSSGMASAVDAGARRVSDFLADLRVRRVPVAAGPLLNVNTPEDLARALGASDMVQGT